MVNGPFETQWVRRETEPLDITVEGKTTTVIFDIVDMGSKKDMILGRLWHKEYDSDISWKGGGHLRPRSTPGPHSTNLMGSADDGSPRSSTPKHVHFQDPSQETGSGRQPATDSGRGGSHINPDQGREQILGRPPARAPFVDPLQEPPDIRRVRRIQRRAHHEVAVISVDNHGNTQFQEWVNRAEVAEVTAAGKFAYY